MRLLLPIFILTILYLGQPNAFSQINSEKRSMAAAYRFRDKGLIAFADKNYDFAAECFTDYRQKATKVEPAFTDASIYLIRCLLIQDKLEASKVAIDFWKKNSTKNTGPSYINEINYWEAKYLLSSGAFKESEEILLNLISRPNNQAIILQARNSLGECLFLQKKYKAAKAIFNRIKNENSGTNEGTFAQMQLIKLYLIQKRFFWAERQIKQNSKIPNFVYKKELGLYTILLHTMKEEVDQALPLYNKRKLTAPRGKNSDWFICSLQLASLLEKKGKFKEAADCFRQAYNVALTAVEQNQVQLRLAECLLKGQSETEALATLQSYLTQDIDNNARIKVTLRLGSLLKKNKNYKKAAEVINSLQSLSGMSQQSKYQAIVEAAKCQALDKQVDAAIANYLKASKLGVNKDKKGQAVLLAAEASLGEKKYQPASLYYKQAAKIFGKTPKGQSAIYYQGVCLVKSRHLDEANKAFVQALAIAPKSDLSADIHFQYGLALKSKGNHLKAAEQFMIIGKTYPTYKDVVKGLLIASECYVSGNKPELALGLLNKATPKFKKNPLYPNLLYKLIHLNFHSKTGKVSKALELSAILENKYPMLYLTGDAMLWTGDFYSSQGNSELQRSKNATRKGKKAQAKIHSKLSTEKFNKAKEEYLKLVTNFKTHQLAPIALYEAASITFKLGHNAEGLLVQFQKAYPKADKFLRAKVEMLYGEQLTLKGNFKKAIIQFTKATELFGKHPYGLNAKGRLADCQYTMKQYDKAIKTYQELIEAIKKSYDPYKNQIVPLQLVAQPLYKLAKAYEKAGNFTAAKKQYFEIITNHEVEVRQQKLPDWKYYVRAVFDLTELYMLDKEYDNAVKVLKELQKLKLPLRKEVKKRLSILKAKIAATRARKQ